MKKLDSSIITTLGSKVKQQEPLAPYTTFKIGGPAEYFMIARSRDDVVAGVNAALNAHVPVRVIGGATNLVVSDAGIAGLVIKNESHDIKVIAYKGKANHGKMQVDQVVVEADSGVLVNQLVRYTVDESLAGLEHFLGQPGTVGGAVWINAHNMNKGVFFGDFIREAGVIDKDGKVKIVPQEYFHFGYDVSSIQKTGEYVLFVRLVLPRGDKEQLWQDAHKAMEYRRSTQPLGIPSSGCTFRNFSKADAMRLGTPNLTCSAGYLIDRVGLKGYQIGGAKFSDKHANFILNVDNATSKDVMALIALAKSRVKETFGIDLHEEVVPLQ